MIKKQRPHIATSRRSFLKTSSLIAGGAFVLPRFSIGQSGPSANSKLNIAFIGVGGQGQGNLSQMAKEFEASQAAALAKSGSSAVAKSYVDGICLIGDKQTLFSPGMRPNSPRLFDEAAWQEFRRNRPPETLPRIKGGNIAEWIRAVKGDGPTPGSHFGYAEGLTELILLGALAIRTGKDIEWDSDRMKVTNEPSLNQYIKPKVRRGWREYYRS